jgi:hypothetical protein
MHIHTRVVALKGDALASVQLQDPASNIVKEVTVVSNCYHCTLQANTATSLTYAIQTIYTGRLQVTHFPIDVATIGLNGKCSECTPHTSHQRNKLIIGCRLYYLEIGQKALQPGN